MAKPDRPAIVLRTAATTLDWAAALSGRRDMATMRAMAVPSAGGRLKLEERAVPEPGRQEVRIRVHACGVCHSDSLTVEGVMPGIAYPRVPGHEVIGTIEAIGSDVDGWRIGMRVGVGWFGGSCGYC